MEAKASGQVSDFEPLQTRIIRVPVGDLKLLDVNARYMKHETFQRFVDNVKSDGALTSVPFGVLEEDGKYRILSGNHRVQAAQEAGIEEIEVMVTDQNLSPRRKIAIQLSHNSIVGEDNASTLKMLYDEIDSIDMKAYAGLDDKTLQLINSVGSEGLSEAQLDFQTLTMVFLPDELQRAKDILSQALKSVPSDSVWLARFSEYDRWLDSVEAAGASSGVTNMAVSLDILLTLAERHFHELTDDLIDNDPRPSAPWIPLSTVIGTDRVPAGAAATIKRAIQKMSGKEEIGEKNLWQALEYWAAEYLAGA